MMLDMAMGGSTNTILHLLAIVHEAGVDFNLKDIDRLSRFIPVLCKVAPNSRYHIQDVNRAGGVMGIMSELAKGGYLHSRALRIDYPTLGQAIEDHNFRNKQADARKVAKYLAAPCNIKNLSMGKNKTLMTVTMRTEAGVAYGI
jgi:dihydroxy-acid dehydratase